MSLSFSDLLNIDVPQSIVWAPYHTQFLAEIIHSIISIAINLLGTPKPLYLAQTLLQWITH